MLKYSRETKDQLFILPGSEINRYPDLILRWPESLDKIKPNMLQTPMISQHSANEAHKLPADIHIETNEVVTFDTRPYEQHIYDKKLTMTSWSVIALLTLVITTADGKNVQKTDLLRTFEAARTPNVQDIHQRNVWMWQWKP